MHTFVQQGSPWNPDPRFDFDLASYSLVRSFAGRLGDLTQKFPDIPWDTVPNTGAPCGMNCGSRLM